MAAALSTDLLKFGFEDEAIMAFLTLPVLVIHIFTETSPVDSDVYCANGYSGSTLRIGIGKTSGPVESGGDISERESTLRTSARVSVSRMRRVSVGRCGEDDPQPAVSRIATSNENTMMSLMTCCGCLTAAFHLRRRTFEYYTAGTPAFN